MKFILFLFFFIIFLFVVPLANAVTGEPIRIIIPRLALSLPVVRVPIINETWQVSTTAASFGESPTVPGEFGSTVIFAHAMPHLFKSLPNLQTGDFIHVLTKSRWFTYKVYDTFVVDPKDTSVLTAKNQYELTVYTCIGEQFEKRFVAKADLIAAPFLLREGVN